MAYIDEMTGEWFPVSATSSNIATNPLINYNNSEGLFGLTQGTWGNMGQAAGLAGSVLSGYDSLFGNKAKLYKEQMGMLKDQRAQNKKMIADREAYKQNIGSGLANAFASKPVVI